MKPINLPHFEMLPEPSAPMPQTVLGETAVICEEEHLHTAIVGDRTAALQTTIEQLQAMKVPDPRGISAAKRLVRAAFRKPFSSQQDRAELTAWLEGMAFGSYEDSARAFKEDADWSRHISQSRKANVLSEVTTARRELAQYYAPSQRRQIDEYLEDEELPPIFHYWKACAEESGGKKLAWTEWLIQESDPAAPPFEANGATNEQFLHMMQWNLDLVRRRNADPETQASIKDHKTRIEQAIAFAVEDEQISPALLEHFRRESKASILIGDTFDPNLAFADGYHDVEPERTVLRPRAAFKTIVHERLHGTGGFISAFANEGMTDKFTKILLDADAEQRQAPPPENMYPYDENVRTLDAIMRTACITDVEASAIYAGEDRAANEASLRTLVKERIGADLFGYILDFSAFKTSELIDRAHQRSNEQAAEAIRAGLQPVGANESYVLASADSTAAYWTAREMDDILSEFGVALLAGIHEGRTADEKDQYERASIAKIVEQRAEALQVKAQALHAGKSAG